MGAKQKGEVIIEVEIKRSIGRRTRSLSSSSSRFHSALFIVVIVSLPQRASQAKKLPRCDKHGLEREGQVEERRELFTDSGGSGPPLPLRSGTLSFVVGFSTTREAQGDNNASTNHSFIASRNEPAKELCKRRTCCPWKKRKSVKKKVERN